MKKILSIFLIMIMAFAVIGSAAARPDMQRSSSADALEDAEVLAFIPSGDGENAIGYYEDEEENVGPESFAVSGGDVYILDSVKNRIVAIEDGAARYIPVSGIEHPTKFALVGDRFYIVGNGINVMDINGRILRSVSFPEKVAANDIYRVYSNGNELCMLTHDLECFKLNSSDYEWIKDCQIGVDGRFEQIETLSLPNVKVDLDVGPTCLVQYLQHSESELLVGVYEFVPYLPVIETEYTVRKYDMQGQLLGCTVINNLEAYSLPNMVVNVDPSTGIVYTMLCREEGVYITKPNFRMEYQSHMDELTEIAENILESDGKILPTRYSTVTSKTRAEVESRADAARTHQWELHDGNTTPYGNIIIPIQFENKEPPETMHGIPYCFGGWFLSISSGFDQKLAYSITGNTDHDHGHADGTIGLDCSGFVSYAYYISYHGTDDFVSYGHYVNGNQSNSTLICSLSNLKKMDFILRYNVPGHANHIMLFRTLVTSVSINTIESTTVYDASDPDDLMQGVKNKTWQIADLSGSVIRTPYACGGTETCTMGSDYHSNSSKHWKTCIHCGEAGTKSSHTWTSTYVNNDQQHWKECTVCERKSNISDHSWTSTYAHNGQQHWQECTVCGRIRNLADHSWIAYQNGYRCKICFLYVDQYPADKTCNSIVETELY